MFELLKKKSDITTILFILVLAFSQVSFAESALFEFPDIEKDERNSGFTLTPGVGQYGFDSSRNLDDESFYSLALGYQFALPYAIELVYAASDATVSGASNSIDVEQARLDFLYNIGQYGNWQPYLALGVANTSFAETSIEDETSLALGGGVNYQLSDRLALRGDLRHLSSVGDSKSKDLMLSLGLRLFFGSVADKVASASEEGSVQTPLSLNECVASNGEPDLENSACYQKVKQTESVELDVRFAYDSSLVATQFTPDVQALATFMSEYPSTTVVLEGHADNKGTQRYNQKLSQQRADAVASLLSQRYGIASERVSAIGYGESQPLVENVDDLSRAKNRRVVASVSVEIEKVVPLKK